MTTIIHPFDPRTEASQMKNTGALEGNDGSQLQQWPVKLCIFSLLRFKT